ARGDPGLGGRARAPGKDADTLLTHHGPGVVLGIDEALRRAAAAGIDTFHASSLTHPRSDALDAAISDPLRRARADVIPRLAVVADDDHDATVDAALGARVD